VVTERTKDQERERKERERERQMEREKDWKIEGKEDKERAGVK
jgi:hypothetical protein